MQYPGYTSGKIILKQGESYPFEVCNKVLLQDDNWYMVVRDVNGLKHFIAAANYEAYNLIPGSKVMCRVDKINCTGRIFLEPHHPVYEPGKTYTFHIANPSAGFDNNEILVEDIFGNRIKPEFPGAEATIKKGQVALVCFVKAIKNGIPLIEIIE